MPLVDGEGVDAGGGCDDVDDGVYGAYFVEVDFFDGDVVDFGFACAEEFEGVDGGLFDGGGEGCGVDQVADYCEGAAVGVLVLRLVGMGMIVRMIVCVAGFVLVLGFGVVLVGVGLLMVRRVVLGGRDLGFFGELCAFIDVNLCGGDSAAVYLFYLEGGVEVQGGGGLVQDGGIEAGVDEGSEEHVAADAGEAVEVGDAH